MLQILQIVFISLALVCAILVLTFGILKNLKATRFLSILTSGFFVIFAFLLVLNINFSSIALVEVSYIVTLVFSLIAFTITLFYFIKKH